MGVTQERDNGKELGSDYLGILPRFQLALQALVHLPCISCVHAARC